MGYKIVFPSIRSKIQISTPIIPYIFQPGCVGFSPLKNHAGICAALINKKPIIKIIININFISYNIKIQLIYFYQPLQYF